MRKKDNGITLLALIITIVILLILAGVSISTINNSGLLKKSTNAKKTYDESAANETNTLQSYEDILDEYASLKTVGDYIDEINIGDSVYYEPSNKESYIAKDTETGRIPGTGESEN